MGMRKQSQKDGSAEITAINLHRATIVNDSEVF